VLVARFSAPCKGTGLFSQYMPAKDCAPLDRGLRCRFDPDRTYRQILLGTRLACALSGAQFVVPTWLPTTLLPPLSGWTHTQRLQVTPQLTPRLQWLQPLRRSYCSKTLDGIGLQRQSPGGGMAYAGDLKSPVLNGTCGFDPHPGHSA
jgi:hypothetical protein